MNKIQLFGYAGILLVLWFMLTDSKSSDANAQTKIAWEQPSVCTVNTSDWPCLEEKGC